MATLQSPRGRVHTTLWAQSEIRIKYPHAVCLGETYSDDWVAIDNDTPQEALVLRMPSSGTVSAKLVSVAFSLPSSRFFGTILGGRFLGTLTIGNLIISYGILKSLRVTIHLDL